MILCYFCTLIVEKSLFFCNKLRGYVYLFLSIHPGGTFIWGDTFIWKSRVRPKNTMYLWKQVKSSVAPEPRLGSDLARAFGQKARLAQYFKKLILENFS